MDSNYKVANCHRKQKMIDIVFYQFSPIYLVAIAVKQTGNYSWKTQTIG